MIQTSHTRRKRYAIVGTGGRAPMFIDPIADTYREHNELVGMCDISTTRMRWHQDRITRAYGSPRISTYVASDFDRMLQEQHPDTVIVCTPDHTHHDYIIRALEAGCDVISEKPLTISAENFAAIDAAVHRTGHSVRTCFNYRWGVGATKVRKLITSGAIGTIKHVDFEYMLNTSHGADYFRRWHSYKKCSGGLLVHKSTHHFDLINWWIDAIPETVFAMGELAFYGKANAIARGQGQFTNYPRYTGVAEAKGDPFRMDLKEDATLNGLYHEAESETGYLRDQNVFKDDIDIEDTMSVMVKYRTGVTLSYSLNAFCPAEGYRVSITGDAGRIEYVEHSKSHIITGDREIKLECTGRDDKVLTLHKHFCPPEYIDIPTSIGSHGGADPMIQEQIFAPNATEEHHGRNAGHEQGAASLLVGAAANKSLASGVPIRITNLLNFRPDAIHLSQLI